MKYYGTKNNSDYGFYLENFHGAVAITDEEWKDLLFQQSCGKEITHGPEGSPIATEKVISTEEQALTVRKQRDQLLLECDWTQLSDSPISESERTKYAHYRQQLRDIPGQPGFPFDVKWPNLPKNFQ